MLKAYTFVATDHQHLHDFVMRFFDRIEFANGPFTLDLFDKGFRKIVTRHRKVLRTLFCDIYREVSAWSQPERSKLCKSIRDSNKIDQICAGAVTPLKIDKGALGLYENLRKLFLNLYSDVLDGDIVHEELGITLRQHFEAFRQANNGITLCPLCGISELKTQYDNAREQYDHYLPESIYPLSSVNFFNLVPTCKDCNSPEIKGTTDVIAVRNTRLFFPYDRNAKGINISFTIVKDNLSIDAIEWQVACVSCDGQDMEVEAWKKIYKIEERYLGFVKGRIEKWYKAYWEYLKDDELRGLTEEQRQSAYFAFLRSEERECLNVVRKPAFLAFLEGSPLARAAQEAKMYS